MMLFKLSIKNISKSMKDYTIYFLTLILGVAIFYVFNALESQTAMKGISESGYQLVQLMVNILGYVSVLVAFILGFLIVYANCFLIKRRKKEFGLYMMLGMGKSGISRILFGETILIGILSLTVGLIVGIFVSQFMSILVVRLFEADLSAYTFIVSGKAIQKTILYFGIMYFIVLIFNAYAVTKYKLIDLFQANHKGEKQTMKNSLFAVLVFIVAVGMLGYAYYQVGFRPASINITRAGIMIALGCVGTFFMFWSISGFLLKLVQRFKKIYHKNLNAFNLRQLSTNMNTAIFSMTVICLLLFATICAFCSGMSMNSSLNYSLKRMTPVDLCVEKTMDLSGDEGDVIVENSYKTVADMLSEVGFSMDHMKPGYVEISTYICNGLTFEYTLGDFKEQVKEQFPMLLFDSAETIISNSDYNRLAEVYGNETYELQSDQYVVLCNYDNMSMLRDLSLDRGTPINIGEYTLKPAVNKCEDGYLTIAFGKMNTGFFIVPDEVVEKEAGRALTKERNLLAGDYAADTEEGKNEIENMLIAIPEESFDSFKGADVMSRITIKESVTGLAVIITFIVLYLGIIFLISGAAILALKSLSETADSKGRYEILQKIGTDSKMLHKALFSQLGMFFILPLALAIIHSVFGMRFVSYMLAVFNQSDMLSSIGITAVILLIIYGSYFLATYNGSRRMLDEK